MCIVAQGSFVCGDSVVVSFVSSSSLGDSAVYLLLGSMEFEGFFVKHVLGMSSCFLISNFRK